jgi:hypothetical protein
MKYVSVVLVLLFAGPGLAQAEPLVNGGAEAGDLTGWSAAASVGATTRVNHQAYGPVIYPYSGEYFFAFGSGSFAFMSQTGPLGLTTPALKLSGYYQTEMYGGQNDFGEASLSFLDVSDQPLISASTGHLVWMDSSGSWKPFELRLEVPLNAAKWQVELQGTKVLGSYINVFYDNVSLAAVPEPSSVSLLGLGIVCLLGSAWRGRQRAAEASSAGATRTP